MTLTVKEYLYFIYKASCTKYLSFFTDVGTNIVKKENDTVFLTKAPFLWRKVFYGGKLSRKGGSITISAKSTLASFCVRKKFNNLFA